MSDIKMKTTNCQTEAEKYYLEKTIENCKQFLRDSGETQKQKIVQWAESLERLYEIGKSDTPIHLISSRLRKEARSDLHWKEGQIDYISECLPERFINEANIHNPRGHNQNRTGEAVQVVDQVENLLSEEVLQNLDKQNLRRLHKFLKKDKMMLNLLLLIKVLQ